MVIRQTEIDMDNRTTPPWSDARTEWFRDYLKEHDNDECEVVAVINMVGYLPRPDGPEDTVPFDTDGHGIAAWAMFDFWLESDPVLRVQIPQGADPRLMASMLRKMADMVEREGSRLCNLDYDGEAHAHREPDGRVEFS